jgi:tetratricopeptide (TPR) repeat protein
LIIGTQFTPSLREILHIPVKNPPVMAQGTVLENGGTESGTIRKIVWQGAIDIWKHYPVFGTGVETFAYSYYLYRPIAHNVTSEWDFIYNKAHNEFLNFAADTGTVGLVSYLILIGFSIYQISKIKNQKLEFKNTSKNLKSENFSLLNSDFDFYPFTFALLAGFISLSVSNFFGFSVVPTQLEFFLFPAFAIAIAEQSLENKEQSKKLEIYQKIVIAFVLCTMSYILFSVGKYWYSDILYSKAKAENGAQRPDLSVPLLSQAIKFEPNQALYYGELSSSYSTIAMAYDQIKDASTSAEVSTLAAESIQKAISLAPANVNLHRQMFGIYVRLSTIDEKYLGIARDSLLETIKLAPTDAKLYYNLGIADANLGETSKADLDFQKAIELKANYADARVQYAALLVHLNKINEAKDQLNYVLTKIDPGNSTAKTALDNLK